MKGTLLALAFLFGPLSMNAQNAGGQSKVYISTSSKAVKYHKSRDCFSLSNDQDRLLYVTVDEAKRLDRTPCKNCYGRTSVSASSETVYVCSGSSSKMYHGKRDCRGLQSCDGTVKRMSVSEARKGGKTACNICLK